MFEIGFWELVVVGIVALWVLGPERLPAVARVCGRWLLRAKHSYQTVKNEFTEEFRRLPTLTHQTPQNPLNEKPISSEGQKNDTDNHIVTADDFSGRR